MSLIRVTYGMATVELDGWETRAATDRIATAGYPTDDLIEATRRALAAADDSRADALAELLREPS